MSNIKKFFSKLKSEVKFAKAGEGHRLNEASAAPRNVEHHSRPQTTARQSSEGSAAARAAAEAAHQRLQQQQQALQNSAGPSKSSFMLKSKEKETFLKII